MLSDKELSRARAYNKRVAGNEWRRAELPDSVRGVSASSNEFAMGIAQLQLAVNVHVDGCYGPATARMVRSALPNAIRAKGIDISGHNSIDNPDETFRTVLSDGVSFVFVKATEGTGYRFKRHRELIDSARAAGLRVGAYHYAKPSHEVDDARREAEWYHKHMGTSSIDMRPVLDFESSSLSPKALTTWALTFMHELSTLRGVNPIVYTYTWFWKGALKKTTQLHQYALWQAEYNNNPSPSTLAAWTTWTVWQHWNKGHVAGIDGNVDINVLNGHACDIERLLGIPHDDAGRC